MRKNLVALSLFGLLTSAVVNAGICYSQPWTPKLASFISRVNTCDVAMPFPVIALDDFYCYTDENITRVRWWGTGSALYAENPGAFGFYIAIYDSEGCMPAAKVYEACVPVKMCKKVGTDCTGKPVYRFGAALPGAGFKPVPGKFYFLQISEIDANSPNQGVVDFAWSGHRPLKHCPALQILASGLKIQPLIDPCDQMPDDLAFQLLSKTVGGVITGGFGGALGQVFQAQLREIGGEVVETTTVDTDSNGNFEFTTDAPEGDYELVLSNGCALKIKIVTPITVLDAVQLPPADLTLGDFTGDNAVGQGDLNVLLANFGAVGP